MKRLWLATLLALLAASAHAASIDALLRAYPDFLAGYDGANLIWRDGTRMPVSADTARRSGPDAIEHDSILDQIAATYPAFAPAAPPLDDPGRVRNRAFFDKMYGDCSRGEVAPKLVRVTWLPRSWGRDVSITSVNGVDRALAAISSELDDLPAADRKYLQPLGGTYNCRAVAGTDRRSMHGWGAAIDLNPAFSDYWRWSRATSDLPPYRDRIPLEIVAIFERHGFIWGGRWSHFDTMHFEYRPELLDQRPP